MAYSFIGLAKETLELVKEPLTIKEYKVTKTLNNLNLKYSLL